MELIMVILSVLALLITTTGVTWGIAFQSGKNSQRIAAVEQDVERLKDR